MIRRSVFLGFAIAIGAAAIILSFLTNIKGHPTPLVGGEPGAPMKPTSQPDKGIGEAMTSADSSQKPAEIIEHRGLLNRSDYALKRQRPEIRDVITHRDRFVALAEGGDGNAAMGLFFADSAYDFKQGETFSTKSPQRDGARRWLEIAADNGDLEAMIQFAQSADFRFWTPGMLQNLSAEEKVAISQRAMKYLTTAAALGMRDAFTQLADAYEFGRFGVQDVILSYAYRLALNRISPDEQTNRLVQAKSSLLNNFNMQVANKAADDIVQSTASATVN